MISMTTYFNTMPREIVVRGVERNSAVEKLLALMGFKRGRSTHDGTPVPDRWAYAHPNTIAIEQMEECVGDLVRARRARWPGQTGQVGAGYGKAMVEAAHRAGLLPEGEG